MNASEVSIVSTAVDYDPFAGAALARVVPATESQREIWLAAKLEQEASLAYNESVSIKFSGELDVAALQAALQGVVDRHEALRATLSADGNELCIAVHVDVECAVCDLSALDEAAREQHVASALGLAVTAPFDLEHGPLVRAQLLRLSPQEHLLVFTAHHIVCDGWSFGVIARDLAALYAQRIGQGEGPAPADAFTDYALAEAARAQTAGGHADEQYWLSRFSGELTSLDLPVDSTRRRRRTFASQREDRLLDAALVAEIKRMGARRGASFYATLLAGFSALLQRLSGQDDVVIGIPSAGQAADGHDNLVGHCVNVLPLRSAIDPQAPFADLLDHLRGDLLDAFDHRQYTLGSLLARLAMPRDPSRLPLVSVLFNLDQALDERTVSFPGLRFEFCGNARAFENFELFVNAVQLSDGLRLECQYNSDLFHAETIRCWLDAYETLLRNAVAAPDTAVAKLGLLSEPAQRHIASLQPESTPYPEHRLAHEYFEQQVDQVPNNAAVRHSARQLSYAELEARANRLAHVLRERGVGRGSLVGIALARSTDMLAAVLAVLKAGAGYVPLDPSFPADRLAFMAEDAALAALIVDDDTPQAFQFSPSRVLSLKRDADAIASASPARLPRDDAAARPDSVAYLIFTSGSTGRPKGVRVPHRATSNFLTSMQQVPGIAEDDRLVAVTTLSFDIAFMELMLPLSAGAEVVIADRDDVRDGAALRRLVEQSEATMMQATPAGWRILIEAGWNGREGFRAVSGGEPLAIDLAEALLQRCSEVWNGYGPTETTVYSTYWRVAEPRSGIFIGRPIANTAVHILDQHGARCPLGVPGEIYIGGAGVTLGYLNRPELDAERFLPDPFVDRDNESCEEPDPLPCAQGRAGVGLHGLAAQLESNARFTSPHPNPPLRAGEGADHATAEVGAPRMYRTGDRGRWLANGLLEHLGRLDFQVKVRGYRIELGEIECVLADVPEIERAVVLAREDRPADVRLVAYVVMREQMPFDESSLRDRLKQRLPEYMLPQHIMPLDAVPLLPNGKIDRKALPAPHIHSVASETARIAPRNDDERRVAAAMESVLSLPELDVRDDFFALGGHSLLAAQLTARLNREFGITLSFRTLFDAPTIAELAAAIRAQVDSGAAPAAQPIVPREDQSRAPLSLMQRRLWSLEELQPGRVTYNAPSAHRLRGHLDEGAFQRALHTLMQRQPILRTAFRRNGNDVEQIVVADVDVPLFPAEDLSGLPESEREAALMKRLQTLTDTSFDLTQAPLFSARMFRLGEDDHVFFFMPHHIIWDGWSFDILYAELSSLYRAAVEGAPSPLPPLPVSYGDFAQWHTQWLEGPQFQTQLAFWRERLAKMADIRALPTDQPRRPGMSGIGRTEWIRVPKAATDAMHEVARMADATLNMTLLALYYVLLSAMAGEKDLVVGTPVRARNQTEVESVMGYFNNLLPLHIAVDSTLSFIDFVRHVKGAAIESFGHPDVPLEYLQRELRVGAGSGAVLYQALFSFQDARQRIVDWGALAHEQILLFQSGATEDLGLWFLESNKGMVGGVTYNADILQAETARLLRDRYLAMMARVSEDPRQLVSALTAIGEAELAQEREWNATSAAMRLPANIPAMFERQADQTPDRTALTFGCWGTPYIEIEHRANRIAHCLRKRGAGTGIAIGLAAEPGINRLAGLLGILKTGGVCVLLDPTDPPVRLEEIITDARIALLAGDSALENTLQWSRAQAVWFDADTVEIIAAPSDRHASATESVGDETAIVVYAPNANGRPSGAAFTHRAVANMLQGVQDALSLSPDDRILATASPATGEAIVENLLPMAIGAELILANPREAHDGEALARLTQNHRASAMFAAPDAWQAMFAAGWAGRADMKAICIGGLPTPELAIRLSECCAGIWSVSGAADSAPAITCGRIERPAESLHSGRPLANTSVWILDDQQQPCPIGAIGDMHVGSVSLSRPFGVRGEADDEGFLDVMREPQLRRTHCRGRWLVSGHIQEMGRTDRRERIHGRDVDLATVEAELLSQPGVMRAVAVPRMNQAGNTRIDAYAVAASGHALQSDQLIAALAAALPAHEVPQRVVLLDALPILANGMVDIAALPLPAESSGDDDLDSATQPKTANEQLLAALWKELLNITRVRTSDNFFDIGGHSLLAVDMAARVQRQTGMSLNLLDIANGTLGTLAAGLSEGAAKETQPVKLGSRLSRLFGRR